jgi:hypothetical protein
VIWVVVGLLWLPWAALAAWLAREVQLGRGVNDAALTSDERARRYEAEAAAEREPFQQVTVDLAAGSAGN